MYMIIFHLKFLRKNYILATNYNTIFHGNRQQHHLRPYFEIIFKIVFIFIEKSEKQISQINILFFTSSRGYQQFQRDRKNLPDVILRLRDLLLKALWHGFYLLNEKSCSNPSFDTNTSKNHVKEVSQIPRKELW